ncbi:MAG: TIGR03084 family metal-binding protein [Pseudomonadota bacterium]
MPFFEAADFVAESEQLATPTASLDNATLATETQFKNWRIADILGHLAIWNEAACMTYETPDDFQRFMSNMLMALQSGQSMREFEATKLGGLSDEAVRARWMESVADTGRVFADADPKHRVAWGGPSMSLRSCLSARIMETWAHGQAIYDALGQQRPRTDRIRHIVALGVNTFAFNFKTHGKTPPDRMPFLQLSAPSGDIWCHGDEANNDRICGEAFEFCQVVTQVRHIDDTNLTVTGDTARQWMAIAQCFAGPAHPPPAPGSRFIR